MAKQADNLATVLSNDDATLVEQARRGDDRAFTQLYWRYARYLAGLIYRTMGNEQDVDDLVQQAFIDASAALDALREPEHFRAWLASIAIRRVHRRLRERRRWRFLTRALEPIAAQVSNPADRHRVAQLYDALGRLSPDVRIPWVLHFIEGQTLPEVAAMCDVSVATAKRRIRAAEERIVRRLTHD